MALAIIIVAAGLLRLDAFVGKYGTLDRPAWARVATQQVAPLAVPLRPAGVEWTRERAPYVGGDPINYIAYAREMESLYQPHVREPVFLALTRLALWALDDQDAAVSLASAAGSLLAVLATYLLGAALLSPAVGLGAAFLMAAEFEAITWAPDGWRDDTFTATVLLAAWALLRLHRHPSFARALAAGGLCGIACLTRITALTFVLPAVVWLIAAAPRDKRREHARHAGLALLLASAIVAPYLISCTIATGDPFFALNYHTVYYRHAEGMDIAESMSALEYVRTKFASRPIRTLDTGFAGLFVQPFETKWNGLGWMPGLGTAAKWLAVAGLAMLPFARSGRLLLVILLTSLMPYALTWNLGDGAAWRFTMHAYPFYLVAAAYAVVAGTRALAPARAAADRRPLVRALVPRALMVVALGLAGVAAHRGLPWLVVKEAIAAGEPTSVETGPRDAVFYRTGWSPLRRDGAVVSRVSTGERSTIHIPLPAQRAYDLVLRVDPAAPEREQRLSVFLNRRLVAVLRLALDPARVGTYRVPLPPDATRAGDNELLLVAEPLVLAGGAGDRFAWLDPEAQIGVRVWYVRVTALSVPPRSSGVAVKGDALAEHVEVGRLVDALGGAQVQGVFDHLGASRRHTHDRDGIGQVALPDFPQKGESVHDRHHEIEQDDARALSGQRFEPLAAVVRGQHIEAGGSESRPFDFTHVGIVFDHENRSRRVRLLKKRDLFERRRSLLAAQRGLPSRVRSFPYLGTGLPIH